MKTRVFLEVIVIFVAWAFVVMGASPARAHDPPDSLPYLVKNINVAGNGASSLLSATNSFTRPSPVVADGFIYFRAYDGVNGSAFAVVLWKSDGTKAGTTMVKAVFPYVPVNVNGTLFFTADDGVHGYELWKSDGTAWGTRLVKDIWPGSDGSFPYALTPVHGTLYFGAADGGDRNGLWKSNGTEAGTAFLGGPFPDQLTQVNDTSSSVPMTI